MRLRTRLTLVFCAGAAAILVFAVVLQSALLSRHARIQAETSARAAGEEVQRSVEHRLSELRGHLASVGRAPTRAAPLDTEAYDGPPQSNALDEPKALEQLEQTIGSDIFALVFARGGGVLWRSQSVERAAPGLAEWLGKSSLIARQGRARPRYGVVPSPFGPLVGASTPRGDGGDELVLVRPIELNLASRERAAVRVDVLPAIETRFSEAEQPVFRALVGGESTRLQEDEFGYTFYGALRDPEDRVALVTRAAAPRVDVSLQRAWLTDSFAWMLVVALVGLLLLLRFLEVQVLAPLRALEQHARRIGRTDHGRVQIRLDRDDEFGDLARALDAMLRSLDSAQQEVIRSARFAGMSDVSRGVVHSIGNVLTSVNVSTHLMLRELGGAGVDDLRLLIDELRQHQDDLGVYVTEDPNGRFLLPFLDAMTASFEDLQTRCMVELEAVEKGIQHVVQLVRSVDKYSNGGTFNEVVDVPELIEMAIGIGCLARGGAHEVEIVRDFRPIPEVIMDRYKLTTILIHLITNALDALDQSALAHRRLELALYPAGHDRFVIEVTDTGLGIPPEHLDSIFTPGFTTKDDASGEGLHTTANLCREMGISIGAMSEGSGTGATFKLRLPYRANEGDEAVNEPPPALPSLSSGPVQFDRRQSHSFRP